MTATLTAAPGRSLGSRVELRGPMAPRYDEILTPAALEFVRRLDELVAGRRCELLTERRRRREALARGTEQLGFLPHTKQIRDDDSWRVAGAAPGLVDRRVEITGPPEPRMAVNALNSGAKVWMADLEDATSPTWSNVIGGQVTLFDAIRRRLDFISGDKRYVIGDSGAAAATIVMRPRGWHLVDKHVLVDGRPVSASMLDFGLYLFHNARELIGRGAGPYVYLPKLENHLEARLWNDVFLFAQAELDLPPGTIRATVLIETITAAFEMDEILYELRTHAAGLNAGRWDYIFSLIKNLAGRGPQFGLPDRAEVTMTVPFLRAYTELLVRTCHRRGAHAIGGMSAFIPSRDADRNATAFAKVRQDKQREADDGFDGSWVAHPGLVQVCREVFDTALGERPSQLDRLRPEVSVTAADLLAVDRTGGRVTRNGLRTNVSVALRYLDAWLRGSGAVAIDGLMEDAATAEISRCQLWQWLHNHTMLDDGSSVTRELVASVMREELDRATAELGPGRLEEARAILIETALGETLPEFFTTGAYARYLVRRE